MKLAALAVKHNTDKHVHGYCPHYEQHIGHMKNLPVTMLEIGIASGASLRMWNDYFTNDDARITGIDIDPDCVHEVGDRVRTIIADGTKWGMDSKFDLIIDDGSHVSADIFNAFYLHWPNLRAGGWYVIEDWAVQLRADYGGNGTTSSALEMAEKFFRNVLLGHAGNDPLGIKSVHAYDEILFLEKQ